MLPMVQINVTLVELVVYISFLLFLILGSCFAEVTGGSMKECSYTYEFVQTVYDLIWKILDPGEGDGEMWFNKHEDELSVAGVIMYFCYQGFVFLVLINLLIAVFNATVQR